MNKKILIGSIIAVAILVLVSSSSAIDVNINGDNHPPDKPEIHGQANGIVGLSYEYVICTTDPDGDDVSYYIEWGDGTHTGWTLYLESGVDASFAHKWYKIDNYDIRCKAKDIYGAESDWGYMQVEMSKSNQIPVSSAIDTETVVVTKSGINFEIETLDNDSEIISYIHGTCDNIVFKSKGLIRHVEIYSYWNHWLRVFEVIGLRYRYPAFQLYYIAPRYVVIPYFIGYSRPTPNSDTYVRGIALGDIEWS